MTEFYNPYYILYEQDTPINFINSEKFNELYVMDENIKTRVTESINTIKSNEIKKWYKNPKNILLKNPFDLQYNDLYFSKFISNNDDVDYKFCVIIYIPGKYPEIFKNETHKIVWFIDIDNYKDILFPGKYHDELLKSFTIYNYKHREVVIDPENYTDLENEYKYDKNELDKFNKHFIDFELNADTNKQFYIIFNNNQEGEYKALFYIYRLLKYLDINNYLDKKLPKEIINFVKKFLSFKISIELKDLAYNIEFEKFELFKNPHNQILDLSTFKLKELINMKNINDLVNIEVNSPLSNIDGILHISTETFNDFSWSLKRYILKILY
jgi:hypothetical protein